MSRHRTGRDQVNSLALGYPTYFEWRAGIFTLLGTWANANETICDFFFNTVRVRGLSKRNRPHPRLHGANNRMD